MPNKNLLNIFEIISRLVVLNYYEKIIYSYKPFSQEQAAIIIQKKKNKMCEL